MEVGIDTEISERFKGCSKTFLERVFAPEEIAYAEKFLLPHERYCAFWCVKEAVIKALGAVVPLSAICTLHDKLGRPFLKKTAKLCACLEKKNLSEIKISISHSGGRAIAICVAN